MTVEQDQKGVLRLFYLVVVIGVVSAGFLLVSTYRLYSFELRGRSRVEAFHLRTLMLTREISTRLPALGKAWTGAAAKPVRSPNSSTALLSIERSLDSISALQRQYLHAEFLGTVERARNRFDRLRTAFEGEVGRADERGVFDVFELTIFQLDRLHSVAVERELEIIATNAARRTRNLAIAVVFVLSVSGALFWRLLVLLRARLKQHTETRNALLERERLLLQTQKMEALGTLVGGVAHDFNNLLTAILGHLEILLDGTPEDDSRHAGMCEVRKAGERAAGLTRQLLVFSRFDVAQARVIDLNLLIRDVEPLLRRLIRADISLIVECERDLGYVKVDHVQMEQVLINLAMNASDAMPRGGELTLTSAIDRVEAGDSRITAVPPGAYARIAVRDTGHGMSPEVRSRVFEPFFTTKEPGRGTGLGLSTVHGIVTRSDGFISVESEAGGGTTFDIYLPLHPAPVTESEPGPPLVEKTRGTETVLVVEDQDQVREVTAAGLRSAGYRVILAADGADALRLCSEYDGTIHLVISDVVMPQMRGPEFVEQARRLFPGIAVIFISGYSEEDVLEAVRESGSPLISKPFKLQHLLKIVRHELDASERRNRGDRSA